MKKFNGLFSAVSWIESCLAAKYEFISGLQEGPILNESTWKILDVKDWKAIFQEDADKNENTCTSHWIMNQVISSDGEYIQVDIPVELDNDEVSTAYSIQSCLFAFKTQLIFKF